MFKTLISAVVGGATGTIAYKALTKANVKNAEFISGCAALAAYGTVSETIDELKNSYDYEEDDEDKRENNEILEDFYDPEEENVTINEEMEDTIKENYEGENDYDMKQCGKFCSVNSSDYENPNVTVTSENESTDSQEGDVKTEDVDNPLSEREEFVNQFIEAAEKGDEAVSEFIEKIEPSSEGDKPSGNSIFDKIKEELDNTGTCFNYSNDVG